MSENKSGGKIWWILAIVGAVLILSCCVAGGVGFVNADTPDSTMPDGKFTPTATVEPSPSSASPTKAAKPAGPATTFSDGQFKVGTDVKPGRYKTDGQSGCYWQKTTTPDASPGDPGFLGNAIPAGQAYVTLANGQYFESRTCGTWRLVVA